LPISVKELRNLGTRDELAEEVCVGKHRRVALLIETSRGHGRQIIDGVARYAKEHGPWSLFLEPRHLDDPPPRWLAGWDGDGLLVRCDTPEVAAAVRARGLPAIDLRGSVAECGLPLVGVDNPAIIRAAVEHFRQRGFRHYAYCDCHGGRRFWMEIRRKQFVDEIRQLGLSCSVYPRRRPRRRRVPWSPEHMGELTRWLLTLPQPVAILACNDEQAHLVLEAAQQVGMWVPDGVAVLGIDNDETFCRVSTPSLSSVDVNALAVGYQAAAALARRMAGQRVPAKTLIRPCGVIARESTDIVATDEPEVAEALRFIRKHACQGIQADDVARHLSISRSTLDRHLGQVVGRSAASVIVQMRLAQVKDYLAGTDLSLRGIAARTGFASLHHMANLFRDRFGVSPGRYRQEMRMGPVARPDGTSRGELSK
jgi:LacI family transcriptional regulator